MYKQKLMDKIQDKMERAQKVKENKERVKNIYEMQMLRLSQNNRNGLNVSSLF